MNKWQKKQYKEMQKPHFKKWQKPHLNNGKNHI